MDNSPKKIKPEPNMNYFVSSVEHKIIYFSCVCVLQRRKNIVQFWNDMRVSK